MIKGSIQEGYITIINITIINTYAPNITIISIYAPNIGAPQYIRQLLTAIKEEMDSNTIIVGTLTPHLHQWMDHPNRKLIRR